MCLKDKYPCVSLNSVYSVYYSAFELLIFFSPSPGTKGNSNNYAITTYDSKRNRQAGAYD
jgi:hypothetical protein